MRKKLVLAAQLKEGELEISEILCSFFFFQSDANTAG